MNIASRGQANPFAPLDTTLIHKSQMNLANQNRRFETSKGLKKENDMSNSKYLILSDKKKQITKSKNSSSKKSSKFKSSGKKLSLKKKMMNINLGNSCDSSNKAKSKPFVGTQFQPYEDSPQMTSPFVNHHLERSNYSVSVMNIDEDDSAPLKLFDGSLLNDNDKLTIHKQATGSKESESTIGTI